MFVYRSNDYFFTLRSRIERELTHSTRSKYDLSKIGFVNTYQYCNMEEFFDNKKTQLFAISEYGSNSLATVAVPSVQDNPDKPDEAPSAKRRKLDH